MDSRFFLTRLKSNVCWTNSVVTLHIHVVSVCSFFTCNVTLHIFRFWSPNHKLFSVPFILAKLILDHNCYYYLTIKFIVTSVFFSSFCRSFCLLIKVMLIVLPSSTIVLSEIKIPITYSTGHDLTLWNKNVICQYK